ncbi:hypothetical protein [Natronorubrum halophilum]|uniref:hypothetical protein n=1 Tax=Natronorubrum halophilum TaxID=1702106 RepID=UPI0013CED176|nr:hypothetical protein [Natronorubrum halophilum]
MTENVQIRNDRLVFQESAKIENEVENRLKRRYGRGVFVQETFEVSNNEIVIRLGTSYPKDVSDRREQDNVMKYINIGDVETLYAVPTGEGYFTIELPDRTELKEKAYGRKQDIVNKLDWSMAKTIYNDVYQLDPVRNQLNSLIQIVRWLKKESELEVSRIDDIQRTQNTQNYLKVLADLDFVIIEEGTVRAGRKMQAADMREFDDSEDVSLDDYEKVVVGNIISEGYHILRDQLGLRMLNHFPKYANSYYYSAIQRQKSDLYLDTDALRETLKYEWGDTVDPLVLDDKLRKLEEANIIEREDEFVVGKRRIYDAINNESQSVPVAD